MLKRVGPHKYVVMSKDGKKKLSKPISRARAIKRLQSVEYHKVQG